MLVFVRSMGRCLDFTLGLGSRFVELPALFALLLRHC